MCLNVIRRSTRFFPTRESCHRRLKSIFKPSTYINITSFLLCTQIHALTYSQTSSDITAACTDKLYRVGNDPHKSINTHFAVCTFVILDRIRLLPCVYFYRLKHTHSHTCNHADACHCVFLGSCFLLYYDCFQGP